MPAMPALPAPLRRPPTRSAERLPSPPKRPLAPTATTDVRAKETTATPEAAPADEAASSEASASSPLPSGELPARDIGTPPPTYRVQLPPPLTLRYEVRRGFLRGTGEIRWQPDGDAYALHFEARVGSLVLLVQSSVGTIGESGLAPRRFVDQRMRRSAQAANFDAAAGRITFSGPPATYALHAGTQDRLSVFVQLAGIAAADPGRLADGAVLPIVVVGARGDAAVWTLRVAGREPVETAAGTVQAIKLVRDARGPADTTAEIWLDPERHYLPAQATLRTASGASEYDLLLEGVSSGP